MAVLTRSIGFETGWNFHNAVEPDKGSAIFRGFIGPDLLYRLNPGLLGFKGIDFNTSGVLRVSAAKEVYTLSENVNGTKVDVSLLNKDRDIM